MKTFIIILIVAAVVVAGYFAFSPGSNGPVGGTPSPSVAASTTPTPAASAGASPSSSPRATPTPSSGGAMEPETRSLSISNFAYSPATLTVHRGDRIVIANQDSVGHSVTSDTGAFDSGIVSKGTTFTLDTASLEPGTYPYHCTPHPFMKGTIVVQ